MKMDISLSNIISNRVFKNNNWQDMKENERQHSLNAIKGFLLKTCQHNSGNYKAIERMNILNLPGNYGIFKRLIVKIDNNDVYNAEYIAGQDYPGEINYIKSIIKREC